MPSRDGKIRVLALDGGGVRGIITLEVLAWLENETGLPLSRMFDLVVGTSTGGLIALGVARSALPQARNIANTYTGMCPYIFRRSTTQKIKSLAQLNGPKYNNSALYDCAIRILGGGSKMSNVECPAMVTTYDIAARAPKFYTTWDTPDVLMVDAAMSTSAAPTYFEPWHNNVDGGVCDNNPALSGVIEACRKFDCTVRDVVCVSIGTGSDMKAYDGAQAASWGLLSWADPLVSIFTDGTSELHAYHLKRLMRDQDVLRIQGPVDGELAGMDNASPNNLAALHEYGVKLVTANLRALNGILPRLVS